MTVSPQHSWLPAATAATRAMTKGAVTLLRAAYVSIKSENGEITEIETNN